MAAGKEATFWHLIQAGEIEEERTPDFRRCERIRWPKPVIEHSEDPTIKVWRNRRGIENRVCLWFVQESYLVVLADRGKYIIPYTAYLVEELHRQRKLQKEYCHLSVPILVVAHQTGVRERHTTLCLTNPVL